MESLLGNREGASPIVRLEDAQRAIKLEICPETSAIEEFLLPRRVQPCELRDNHWAHADLGGRQGETKPWTIS